MSAQEARGVVLVATGPEKYRVLATRAAESLRRHNPGLAIDLFTDRPLDAPVFDRVVILEDPWVRSKIDALKDSRFERTLYLDSDIHVLADLRDVFEVLDRFDIALAHDQFRNDAWCTMFYRHPVPAAFPQFNGGLIALRRSPATQAFLAAWKTAVIDHGVRRDQPALREVLYDSDLRIATLPPEYNLMHTDLLRSWTTQQPAPRVIHSWKLHAFHEERFRDRSDVLPALLGPWQAARLPELLAQDVSLARLAGRSGPVPGMVPEMVPEMVPGATPEAAPESGLRSVRALRRTGQRLARAAPHLGPWARDQLRRFAVWFPGRVKAHASRLWRFWPDPATKPSRKAGQSIAPSIAPGLGPSSGSKDS